MAPSKAAGAPDDDDDDDVAADRGALREHALALDASERDREKYRSLLRDAEGRVEQLLAMNAGLKAELETERDATGRDADGSDVLRASLTDARRRLKETEAQLTAVSEGFQLLKREREQATTVLRSSESVRAALDEERDAVAQLHADLARRQSRAVALMARAGDSIERQRADLELVAASAAAAAPASASAAALKQAAAALGELRRQIRSGVSDLSDPPSGGSRASHLSVCLAAEAEADQSIDRSAANGWSSGADAAGVAAMVAENAAMAAENAALRRSAAAQSDRIEALRSDLAHARNAEAATAERLRAAREAAAVSAADADVLRRSVTSKDGGVAAPEEDAAALRDALEASRELSRRQERENEARVAELREELDRQADVISQAYAGELEGLRGELAAAREAAEAARGAVERAEAAAARHKQAEAEAVKRAVAMEEELRDTPSRREVSTLQKRLELRETEARDLRNEVKMLQEQAAARESVRAREEEERGDDADDDNDDTHDDNDENDALSLTRGSSALIQIRPKSNRDGGDRKGGLAEQGGMNAGAAALSTRHSAPLEEQLEDLHAELSILHEWKSSAEGEMHALREELAEERARRNAEVERRAAVERAERVGGAGSPRRESSGGALPLPSIGEEGVYLGEEDEDGFLVSNDGEEEGGDEGAFVQRPGGSGAESDTQAMMREMWAELQHMRESYKSLNSKYVRQAQRFQRAQQDALERAAGVGAGDTGGRSFAGDGEGGDGGESEAPLRYPQQHPPGLTDSARSSVIMGELSEDSLPGASSPRHDQSSYAHSAVAAAAAAVAAGIHHAHHSHVASRSVSARPAPDGPVFPSRPVPEGSVHVASDVDAMVEDVEEGMDGEDEVLAEYVSAVPPRGPRGQRATQEALERARLAAGHRPESAPPSERRYTNSMRRRGERAAPQEAVSRAAVTAAHRPGSAPSSQDRMTNASWRRGERPASAAAMAAAAAAGAGGRPGSATPSQLVGGRVSVSVGGRTGPLTAAHASHASRPQTAPSSQHMRLRRPPRQGASLPGAGDPRREARRPASAHEMGAGQSSERAAGTRGEVTVIGSTEATAIAGTNTEASTAEGARAAAAFPRRPRTAPADGGEWVDLGEGVGSIPGGGGGVFDDDEDDLFGACSAGGGSGAGDDDSVDFEEEAAAIAVHRARHHVASSRWDASKRDVDVAPIISAGASSRSSSIPAGRPATSPGSLGRRATATAGGGSSAGASPSRPPFNPAAGGAGGIRAAVSAAVSKAAAALAEDAARSAPSSPSSKRLSAKRQKEVVARLSQPQAVAKPRPVRRLQMGGSLTDPHSPAFARRPACDDRKGCAAHGWQGAAAEGSAASEGKKAGLAAPASTAGGGRVSRKKAAAKKAVAGAAAGVAGAGKRARTVATAWG